MPQTYGLVKQTREWSYAAGWQTKQVWCLPYVGDFTISGTNCDGTYTGAIDFIDSNQNAFFTETTDDLCQVTHIADEPWMDGDVVAATGISGSRRVTFTYSVVYLNVPWPASIAQPDYLAGTTLKLHATYGGQLQPLAPRDTAVQRPGPRSQYPAQHLRGPQRVPRRVGPRAGLGRDRFHGSAGLRQRR